MRRPIPKIPGTIAVLCSISAIGWFVWPTRYRYDQLRINGNSFPVRIDRMNGEAWMLTSKGWRLAADTPTQDVASIRLPDDELGKLQSSAELDGSGYLTVEVYNGSTLHLISITVEFVVRVRSDLLKEKTRRQLVINSSYSGPSVRPSSASQFMIDSGWELKEWETWSWRLIEAHGYQQ